MRSSIGLAGRVRASLAGAALLALSHVTGAAVITVTSALDNGGTCPGADCTFRQAIAVAAPNDVINFALTGTGTITLYTGSLIIQKPLTILGSGADRLALQASRGLGLYFPVFILLGAGGQTPSVHISGLTIAGGESNGNGGGIHVEDASLVLDGCTVSGNVSSGANGGGLYFTGNGGSSIRNSTVSGNSADEGGGIWTDTFLSIDNSTISGNVATTVGGGIALNGTQGMNVSNSTIAENSASGLGGGTVNNSTAPLYITSTIVALNTGLDRPNLFGPTTSGGYNLIGALGVQMFSPLATDQVNVSAAAANLGPLAFNGGPTKTHALLSGSKAIEAGYGGGRVTDQRGFARSVDSPILSNGSDGTDVGAYEVQADVLPGCGASRVVTNTADAGAGSLRDVIANVCAGSTITFATNIGSPIALSSGELVIDKGVTIAGPGAKLLTVARSAAAGTPSFGVIKVTATSGDVGIAGLTIANGQGTNGGGVSNLGNSLLTLSGVTISGNTASGQGGGLYNPSLARIVDSTFSGNSAAAGGAIANIFIGAALTLVNSTLSGNTATGDGGGMLNQNIAVITHTTIAGNTAAGHGGGVANTGNITARNSIIALNNATGGSPDFHQALRSEGFNLVGNGAGMTVSPAQFTDQIGTAGAPIDPLLGPLADNGGPTPTRALLANSPALDKGTANGLVGYLYSGLTAPLDADQRGLIRTIDSPGITNQNGGDGTDIGAYETQADQLAGCGATVVTTNADSGPGSLRAVIVGACVGSNITFADNVRGTIALTSGELGVAKTLTITGPGANLLSIARSSAGGTANFRIFNIFPATTHVTLSGLTITNGNTASDFGGGILNQGGTLSLTDMAVSGNYALFGGGGLYNQGGTVVIANSTLAGNSTSIGGAGIANSGTLTIAGSTLSGNMALGGNGGGIATSGTTTITSSTIASNTATPGKGGGIQSSGGSLSVKSTIIALNTATGGSPDVNLALASAGFNLIGNGSGMTITPLASDQVGTTVSPIDPLIDTLKNNGGPTPTRALLAGSPAIDRGSAEGLTGLLFTDQRGMGFPRKYDDPIIANDAAGDGTDIGAFEAVPVANLDIDFSVTATKYDAATDGVLVLRYLFGVAGDAFAAGATGGTAGRNATAVRTYLDAIRGALDIDLDGNVDPLTDGVLIVRYLFGLRGAALTQGAKAAGATRTTQQIEDYLGTLTP